MARKKLINKSEFVNIINNLKGCQFVYIGYTTDAPSLNKKIIGGQSNIYHNRLTSRTEISGIQIGANYENAVNNRINEKDFIAKSLPWGEWLRTNYLISHKGKIYLRAYKTKSTTTNTQYYLDNRLAQGHELSDILNNLRNNNSTSKRQSDIGIDEKDQVKPFTLNIDSINCAVINGITYVISQN